jgi:PPOX class probable FMN-dependent enzyme
MKIDPCENEPSMKIGSGEKELSMKIDSIEKLEAIYGNYETIGEASTAKVVDRMIPQYRAYIEASPFVALATVGPEGLDCSPRGDGRGFVRVHNDRTVMMPDRRGNNRVDSLRTIVRDPRVALLFLIPGSGTTFRVNGHAYLSADPVLLESFAVDGASPRTVILVDIVEMYFQCARAIVRSELWNPARLAENGSLPTPGDVLASLSDSRVGGARYDEAWPARAAATLW